MERFAGRVAVVTGAASGIGRALALRLGAEGMRVVLADVEPAALADAERELAGRGVETLAVRTDVSDEASVRALADAALARFGAVHLLCNNAGVMGGAGFSWEIPSEDWAWILGVNLRGVIHGLRSFVPILIAQDEGHVLNTASMAALVSLPLASPYVASKHAVLALSEALFHELSGRAPQVGVSVLCPEAVDTRIVDAERNRPAALRPALALDTPERRLVEAATRKALAEATAPDAIAERAIAGIRERRFYVLPEGGSWRRAADSRCDDLRAARNPRMVPPV